MFKLTKIILAIFSVLVLFVSNLALITFASAEVKVAPVYDITVAEGDVLDLQFPKNSASSVGALNYRATVSIEAGVLYFSGYSPETTGILTAGDKPLVVSVTTGIPFDPWGQGEVQGRIKLTMTVWPEDSQNIIIPTGWTRTVNVTIKKKDNNTTTTIFPGPTPPGGGDDGGGTGGGPVTPQDPNDKVGPAGFAEMKFIGIDQPYLYTVHFENVSTATAPAQQVRVTDQLASNLDWRSFRLREIAFGDRVIAISENRSFYQGRIDLGADFNGLVLDINAGIDVLTGIASWSFKTIDPATGEPPVDALAGFLPPNDANHRGEGHVIFSIKPKKTLATGTVINNISRIFFDTNEPIDTNVVINTVDGRAPDSSVSQLPETAEQLDFSVQWSGTDDAGGSGLANYDIYVSDNEGAYTPWLTNTSAVSASFTGLGGHTYRFYSLAKDNAGNIEPPPAQPDATISIPSFAPTNPSPANGSTEIDVTTTALSWIAGHGATTHDLYLWKAGDQKPAIPSAANLSGTIFSLGQQLDYSTTYYWEVIAKGGTMGDVSGGIWAFATKAAPVTTSTTQSSTTTSVETGSTTTTSEPPATTTSVEPGSTTSAPPTTTVSTTTTAGVFAVSPEQFTVSLYKGETKNKTLTLLNQTESALDYEITYPALVTVITDPSGDVNPGISTKPLVDITRVDAGFNWNMQWMRMQITFNGPVIPELLGYIYLDTDQNPATGLAGMKKYYGAGVLGYEYLLNYFSAGSQGIVIVEDASGNANPVQILGFYGDGDKVFTVDIPLSLIGSDDGYMNLGMLLGNSALKMDIAQDTTKAVLSGEGTFIPWLTISQTSGTVNAHENLPLTLGFDTTRIKEGIYNDHLTLQTSGSLVTEITVPITLTVYKDGQHIIEGHVSGLTAKAGVTINLYNVGGCSETLLSTTTTDENGDYGFFDLADGDYKVEASKSGYTFTPGYYNISIPRVNQDYLDFIAN